MKQETRDQLELFRQRQKEEDGSGEAEPLTGPSRSETRPGPVPTDSNPWSLARKKRKKASALHPLTETKVRKLSSNQRDEQGPAKAEPPNAPSDSKEEVQPKDEKGPATHLTPALPSNALGLGHYASDSDSD